MTLYLDKNRNAQGVYLVGPDGEVAGVGGTGAGAEQVQGNVASGAADSGNPVKVGGEYLATPPVFTNGMRSDLQTSANGSVFVDLARGANNRTPSTDALPTSAGLNTFSQNGYFNGTTWDRMRGDVNGLWTTGNVQFLESTAPIAAGAFFNSSFRTAPGWSSRVGARATSSQPGRVIIFVTVDGGGTYLPVKEQALIPTAGAFACEVSTSVRSSASAQYLVQLTNSGLVASTGTSLSIGFTSGAGDAASDANGTFMVGNVASGTLDAGNPVKVGAEYLSTAPVFTTGQRTDMQSSANGSLYVDFGRGSNNRSPTADAIAAATGINTYSQNAYFNGTTWDRQKGDVTGAWSHAPANTVSTALSNTIATVGATATVAFTNTTRQEVINPSTATLWASWATPAVNGAGSFQIAPGGTFSTDRTAGTLTLLSTAATQPFTVNRYS